MSVRAKTIIIIGTTFLCLVGILYFASRYHLLPVSARVEQSQLYDLATQSRNAVNIEIEELNRKLIDWARWADITDYMQDADPGETPPNLNDSTFVDQRLNVVLLLDRTGKVVFSRGFDLEKRQKQPVSPALITYLSMHKSLWPLRTVTSGKRGVVMLPENPIMIAIQPISREGTGPVLGVMVIGRYLDRRETMRIGSTTRLTLRQYSFSDQSLPDDLRIARGKLSDVHPNYSQPLTPRLAAGYALLPDIADQPALILRVEKPRETYHLGESGVLYSLGFFTATGLLFGLIIILLLEKLVLARIARLNDRVVRIGAEGDLAARVDMPGRDELSSLANSVNRMLGALELSQKELWSKEALRESEERYRQLVESSPDAVLIISDGRFDFMNAAGAALLGVALPDKLIGESILNVVQKKQRRVLIKQFKQSTTTDQGIARLETKLKKFDGEIIDVEAALTPFIYQGHPAIQIIARDISERKRVEEQLHYLAYYDVLTGLPNRIMLKNHLVHQLARARRERTSVAVMLLDLDRFKEINDSLGHTIGDEVLKAVAARLSLCLRESDMVARISGDEFAIVLPEVHNAVEAEVTARRVLQGFVEPLMIDNYELFLTASIGISMYPSDGITVESLFKNADLGMYRAKAQGRNSYHFFSPEIGNVISERRKMEHSLRRAINRQELRVYYQPQIDLLKRSIIGVEALVRWHHPEYGLISPSTFIPLAEETGVIGQIDEWVLRTACEQCHAWQLAGLPTLRLAVNVSARHFFRQEFLEMLMLVLNETGISPSRLEMEITENTAMRDLEQTHTVFNVLHDLGVHIAIDDYGTGYSSLYYLKRFPIDTLKIDRSFVQDILRDPDGAAIVDAIIAMAHSLKRRVIAEAVETDEQLEFLLAHHCDVVQGEIFGAPMPADEFQCLLAQNIWDRSLLAIN